MQFFNINCDIGLRSVQRDSIGFVNFVASEGHSTVDQRQCLCMLSWRLVSTIAMQGHRRQSLTSCNGCPTLLFAWSPIRGSLIEDCRHKEAWTLLHDELHWLDEPDIGSRLNSALPLSPWPGTSVGRWPTHSSLWSCFSSIRLRSANRHHHCISLLTQHLRLSGFFDRWSDRPFFPMNS